MLFGDVVWRAGQKEECPMDIQNDEPGEERDIRPYRCVPTGRYIHHANILLIL